jgi:methyl-accepting chemotaxis protein
MIRFNLRNKLLFVFLCVGILPFTFMAIFSVTNAQKALQHQAFSQMQGMRDVKEGQVSGYLQNIKDQVLTFSEDHMIVNAMSQFSSFYDSFSKENALNKNDISGFRKELAEYYRNSEKMNAQAEQLRDYVGELVFLVTGRHDREDTALQHRPVKKAAAGTHKHVTGSKKMLGHGTSEVRPDQIIPFDDDEDFKNF